MKWIKDLLIERQLSKKLKLKEAKDIKIPKTFSCVGILANSESEFLETKTVVRGLWSYKIRIIGLFYSEQPSKLIEAFSTQHFTLSGLPSDYLNEFKLENMDFILVPSLHLNPYLRYLLLENQCDFKIGFYSKENEPYLDLMLGLDEEQLGSNIHHLLDYLKKIKEPC
jgi:hypothetical protein